MRLILDAQKTGLQVINFLDHSAVCFIRGIGHTQIQAVNADFQIIPALSQAGLLVVGRDAGHNDHAGFLVGDGDRLPNLLQDLLMCQVGHLTCHTRNQEADDAGIHTGLNLTAERRPVDFLCIWPEGSDDRGNNTADRE